MILTQKYPKLANLLRLGNLITFPAEKSKPPKIIKNRLNFAPTHVYTAGKIQVFEKKSEFFKKILLKSTPSIINKNLSSVIDNS